MGRKNIALIAGGDSGEYVISIASSRMIRENIDPAVYQVYLIVMKGKKWVWQKDDGTEVDVDRNDFSVMDGERKIHFHCAFITIHGTPGENGKLQGYFDLLNIPYNTAGLLASALTFNKHYCNLVVARLGFPVPRSIKLTRGRNYTAGEVLKSVTLPVFVKPNEGGSSLGMSRVHKPEDLMAAIEVAFDHDRDVLVEEYLDGVELTCGVFQYKGEVKALPVTEIVSKTKAEFFDYEAKYTPGAADEITPARISDELTARVKESAAFLYEALDMKGLTRFDFIYSRDTLFFIEVNVTPGMTETSIVPQQAAVDGISNRQLFSMILEEALSRK